MPITGFRNYRATEDLIGQWIFEVGIVDWEGHTPYMVWKRFRIWKTEPDDARIDRAKAAALGDSRFFKMCSMCKELNNAGHMCESTICQSCAEEHLGVVY